MQAHREVNCVVAFDAAGKKFMAASPDGRILIEIDHSRTMSVERCRAILAKASELSGREVVAVHVVHNIYGGKGELVYARRWDFNKENGEMLERKFDRRN